MNVQLHRYGLVVFEQALPGTFCDNLIKILAVRDKPYTEVNSSNSHYSEGTHYSEKTIYIEDSKTLKAELSSHIMALKTAYFDLLSIDNKHEIASFTDPIIKYYAVDKSDQFLLHFDSRGHTAARALVMIWYLCDVNEGGETVFPYLDVDIKPEKGNCLIFPPYWNYAHLARKPISNDKVTLNVFGNF